MQIVRQVVSQDSLLFHALTIIVTLAMCYPFYRWCEKPFIRPGGGTGSRTAPHADPAAPASIATPQ